jgi:hypothetical protein
LYNIEIFFVIPTKGPRSTTFNDNLSMNFYTYKKKTTNNKFSHQFSIFLNIKEFRSNDLKMFIDTLWYDNVDEYDFLGSKMFFQ